MNCSNYCHQGRLPCATPWTCGKYGQQAAYDDASRCVQLYGPEPEETPEPKKRPLWLLVAGAFFALLFVLVHSADYWPRLVSFMGAV